MGTLVLPGVPADAALPTPPPSGPELTSFQIDGNPDGPNDWDVPYTAGTTPAPNLYSTTGMLPANFYPTFMAADFEAPGTTPVPNPAYPRVTGAPEFCGTTAQPRDDVFTGIGSQSVIGQLRIADPLYSLGGAVVLGCANGNLSNNKNNLLGAYAAFEVVEVPDGAGGSQLQYVLYGAWERNLGLGGELSIYYPVISGGARPADGLGRPLNIVGDRIIGFNYSDSPTVDFTFEIFEWNGTAWELVDTITTGTDGITDGFQAAVGPPGDAAFGEFALNLTTTGALPENDTAGCQPVSVADYVFTSTGNSLSSVLVDYVRGPGFDFTNCGSLEVEKTAQFVPDTPEDFPFYVLQADAETIFPADQIPVTDPPSTTTQLNDFLSYPYPPGTYENPDIYTPMIAEPDYLINEQPAPDGWQRVALECTYKNIFDPILDPTTGNPTGEFNEVTTTFQSGLNGTPFAIPPVQDFDGSGVIDEVDREYFRTSCVITNDANTITIVKDAVPDDPSPDWSFLAQLGADPAIPFVLNDPNDPSRTFVVDQGEANQFDELDIAIPPFWDRTDVTCDPGDDDPQISVQPSPTDEGVVVTIDSGPVRDVTCTFTNTQRRQPYQIIVTPPVATNPLGDTHTYFVELRTDADDDGTLDDPVIGATVDLAWTGAAGSGIAEANGAPVVGAPAASATCTTLAPFPPYLGGLCRVEVTSPDDPGSGSLTASFDLPNPGALAPQFPSPSADNTCTSPTSGPDNLLTDCNVQPVQDAQEIEAVGEKDWVGYEVTVEADGTNLVGDAHTFTIDVDRADGTIPPPAAPGVTVNFTWPGPNGTGAVTEVNGSSDPGATSCLTDANGQCTVTVQSAVPGSGTLTVTSVEGNLLGVGVSPETPLPGSDLTATKTWVEMQASVEADAVNLVGDDHVFTVTATYDDGTGPQPVPVPDGSTIEYLWSGATAAAPPTACTTIGGTCDVTVSSDLAGSGTLTIQSVSVDFAGDVVLDTSLDVIAGGSLSASKTWVEFQANAFPDATNLTEDDHIFTLAATSDDGTGETAVPAGSTINFTWTPNGGGTVTQVNGVDAPGATSCTTNASGECTVTVSSSTPGFGTIEIVSVDATIGGTPLTGVTTTTPPSLVTAIGGSLTAIKNWIAFDVDITPLTAVNPVGVDHTFTISVQVDDGTGLVPLSIPPDSGSVEWSFASPDGSNPTGTCTLEAGGTCEVVISTTAFGTGTLTATGLSVTYGGVAFGPIDLTADGPGQSADLAIPVDADKTWVDWRVTTSGDATNAVDQAHVFTLTLERNDGTGWTPEGAGNLIAATWSGPAGSVITAASGGTVASDGLSASCSTDASGQCTITVDSPNSGSGTLTIEDIVVSLPGYVPPPSPAPGDQFLFTIDTVEVVKTWVALRGAVTPPAATNIVGDAHDFTILIETMGDAGWVPAPAGTTVSFNWTGSGAVTGVDEPGPDATSCTLRDDNGATPENETGTCVVTVDSALTGTGTLTIGDVTSLIIDGTQLVPAGGSLPVGDADASPDVDSRVGTKTWIEFLGDVATTSTNLAGEDHTFVIEAYYDDGTGPFLVPDGSTVEFTWTGAGQVTQVNGAPDPGGTTCTTVGNICAVTVSSPTPGSGTIQLTSVTATIDGSQLTGNATAAPPGLVAFDQGSLTADKTWVELLADVAVTATNVVGDPHTFTIEASYDDGTGPTPVPTGTTVDFTWTGAGQVTQVNGADDLDATSCTTIDAACTVTVSSDAAGTGTITVTSITATFGADQVVDGAPTATAGGSLTALKTWIELQADVQVTATNLVGDAHVFTIEAYYDFGTGPVLVPGGSTVEFTWTGDGQVTQVNGAPDPGATSCTTVGNVCLVTVSSPTPGSGSIEITSVTIDLGDGDLTGTTATTPPGLVAFDQGSLTADKTWVEFAANVTFSATNLTGDPHVFNLDAVYEDGGGQELVPDGSTITFTWTGAGQVTETNGAPDVDATSCTTTGGTCTVTVNSATLGSGTIEIVSVTATIDGDQLTGVTTTTPPSLVADPDTPDASLTAEKTWIDLTVSVADPGINLTGDDHLFTMTAVYDDGTGPQPANGASFAYTWTGPGGAAPLSPCVAAPDANTCEVTVSSNDPGTGTITIDSVTVTIDGFTFTDVVAVVTPGEALAADKTWVEFDVDITPLEAVNLVNDEHTFTISVRVDDGGGLVPLAIPPSAGTVDWSFDAPDGSTSTGTCTLEAGGTCEVVLNSAIGGVGTLTATALDVVYDGVTLPTVDLTAPGSGQSDELIIPVDALKAWVGYDLQLTPPEATNLWPTAPDHVVTLSLSVFPPNNPLVPIAGQTLDVTLTSSVATITAVGGGGTIDPGGLTATCITDANGDCDVTVTSTGPGAASLAASYTATIGQQNLLIEGVDTAEKTWVAHRITVDPPQAENLVDTNHQFTVRVLVDTGDGRGFVGLAGAVPTLSLSGPGRIVSQTCSAGTGSDGRCRVTITSGTPGTSRLDATYVASAGGETATYRDAGDKTWVDYRISVAPQAATNTVGDPHTFVVTLTTNRGSGFGPAAQQVVAIGGSGVGSIVSIQAAGPSAGTCRTDNAGTCRVTVNSNVQGSRTVTASYGAQVGTTQRTYSDSGRKSWVTEDLPATGSDSRRIAMLGAMLAGLGALLFAASRRRRLMA